MTLYMIGLGLDSEKDISVRGLEIVKRCDFVYLESYTSKLNCGIKDLEKFYGKEITEADRELVEKGADEILEKAKEGNVAFLVVGDVFSATTHTDLRLRAIEKKIEVKIIHNASIINAVGDTGLELYRFGKIASIPFENKHISSPYDVLEMNHKLGLHTLFLLDIDAENQKYMSVREALEYLLRIEKEKGKNLIKESMLCIGCGKLGAEDKKIKVGVVADILKESFHGLQCLIIPGKLHFIEEEALKEYH